MITDSARPIYVPQNYDRIKVVDSLDAVFEQRFESHENVILMPRPGILTGNFNALARTLLKASALSRDDKGEIAKFSKERLEKIRKYMSEVPQSAFFSSQMAAIDAIVADMKVAERFWTKYALKVLGQDGYKKEDDMIAAFHQDGSEEAVEHEGRVMVCYTDPVTEGLRNDQAVFIGKDRAGGSSYVPEEGAKPFSFRCGDAWRHRTMSKVTRDGFIHRSRPVGPEGTPRMVLVCDPGYLSNCEPF